jgi:hypothetical protein
MGHAQISTTQIYTAGANPELAQAYQTAMQHLEQPAPLTLPGPSSESLAKVEAPKPTVPPTRLELPPPDWEAWGTHLPEAIRQASLNYVKRRWAVWPASKRRRRALDLLSAFKNLWDWFLAHRSIRTLGEIGLKDLWAYQADQ